VIVELGTSLERIVHMPPRRRPFTILPIRERDEISATRSRPTSVHTCDGCGELTNLAGLCARCSERDDERWTS
jgi:hypothetical protein